MATSSKAEYLKRYMAGAGDDKKKKKKKREKEEAPKKQLAGLKIVETDAFASVASANDFEDVDSDDELEIRMLNEAIRNKVKKGGMKGSFKSTFTTVDGPEVKCESVDENESLNRPGDSVTKEEQQDTVEAKFQITLKSNTDQAPLRRRRHDSDQSPDRKGRTRHDSDSDQSVSRRRRVSPSNSSIRKENRSPRRKRHDSDNSPPRKRRHDSDESPPRRKRHDSNDQSPPRRKRHDSDDQSPVRRRKRHDSDSSPPRRKRRDSDQSPVRRRQRRDSDQSPPRRRRNESPVANGKQKTLDGKIAGLQSAKDLREEADKLRARESKMFEEMDVSVSGRNAETRVREKHVRTGKRENKEDLEKKEREAKKQAELLEKYKEWNKGVKQLQDRQEQLDEMARVVAGPMTRTAEDVDMNQFLKEKIYEADPMASLIKHKNREEAIDRGDLVYPTYDKPFPPNRYGIRPGYRWDGVDRSNGFEAKLAISQNARQAREREMYSNSNVFD